MSKTELSAAFAELAESIVQAVPTDAKFAVIGIRRRGEAVARRLLPLFEKHGRKADAFGVIDITLYRDDLTAIGPSAVVRGTEVDFDVTDTWLVLIDDVIFTGRSVRAALDEIIDLGRPKAIRLATLVDRGGRELPIQPDFVVATIEADASQNVDVKLLEIDGAEEVELS